MKNEKLKMGGDEACGGTRSKDAGLKRAGDFVPPHLRVIRVRGAACEGTRYAGLKQGRSCGPPMAAPSNLAACAEARIVSGRRRLRARSRAEAARAPGRVAALRQGAAAGCHAKACLFGSEPAGERLFAGTAGLKQAGGCGLPLLRNDRDFRPADPAQDRIAWHAPMCDFPNLPSGSTGAAVDNSVEKPFTIVEKLLKEDAIRWKTG